MSNIYVINDNVKLSREQWFNQIFKLLHFLTPQGKYWVKENGNYKIKKSLFSLRQDRCGAELETVTALNPTIRQSREGAFKRSYLNWKWVRDIASQRKLTDEELKRGLAQIEKEICVFSMDVDGEHRHFESNTKGAERYNKKKSYQAMDYIKNHCDGKWESMFLTLTCSVNEYKSIADAWENYDKLEIKPVLENFRKHYGCEYIRVIESYHNQHPHTHIVLFFPKGTIKGWDKMKNKQRVKFGKLYDEIKKRVKSPVFYLECAKGDNLKHYLTKYILKGNFNEIKSLKEKAGLFTETERKTACELVYLKAFRKHTIEKCKDRTEAAEKERQLNKKACVLHEEKINTQSQSLDSLLQSADLDAASLRRALTSLCINSPFSCATCMKKMSLSRYRETFKCSPQENKKVTDEQEKLFEKKCSAIGCAGCFFSEFAKFIVNWDNSLINRTFYWNRRKNIYDKLCDNWDFNDDESYIMCVAYVVDFYFNSMFIKGSSFEEIVNCKEKESMQAAKNEADEKDRIFNQRWKVAETAVKLEYDIKKFIEPLHLFR